MIFHYAGHYYGDESKLPQREPHLQAVPFDEPEDMQKLSIAATVGALVLIMLFFIPVILRMHSLSDSLAGLLAGVILAGLSMWPHEFLHALCYRSDVYMYFNLKQGMAFVAGTEDMSKGRFIFMCLCPNLILGLIPYILFLCFPQVLGFGVFGALAVGMGAGDYLNVYNAAKQMPKGSRTYLSGMHRIGICEKGRARLF